ncbi:MAG: M48 family metallopeptidase [Planctomycetes bacterium]|nr:M48 family metallopeptidase [Planctomycetota bacterium]
MWEIIAANKRRSVALVIVMAAILFGLGYVIAEAYAPGAGPGGLLVAFIIWVVMALVSYYQGAAIFLGMAGARQISHDDHPRLFNIVEEMRIASGLPKMPDVYIIDDPAPNAFATGRDPAHCAVAVTSGLLSRLNRDELQGVIAHELAHIKNRDVLFMLMVGVMLGAIVLVSDIFLRNLRWGGRIRTRSSSRGGGQAQAILLLIAIVLAILAPIIAQLIYFAISRRREYLADACGATYSRYPEGLASALEKIAASPHVLASANRAMAPMYTVNPLKPSASAAFGLFSTHPPAEERVRILRSMGKSPSFAAYEEAYRRATGQAGVIPRSALAEPEVPEARAAASEPSSDVEQTREVRDLLWKLNAFRFISCDCGAKLKIPPTFKAASVRCPRCSRQHPLAA